MINIVKKELEFDDELKKKIEFICGFYNTTPTIINGNIRKIDRTNLSYIFSNGEVTPFGATKPKGAIVIKIEKIEEFK